MNCKPGDLAVIVGGRFNSGRLVEVVAPYVEGSVPPGCEHWFAWEPEFSWVVRGVGARLFTEYQGLRSHTVARDRVLRPIRDPGDDAVDEVLQRLGNPHKVGA